MDSASPGRSRRGEPSRPVAHPSLRGVPTPDATNFAPPPGKPERWATSPGRHGPARPRSASHPSAPDGGPSSAGTAAAGKGRTIALSDYEQRRLDEIQRALHRDDPGFADAINIGTEATARRTVAAPAFLVGLLVTVAGAVLAQVNH